MNVKSMKNVMAALAVVAMIILAVCAFTLKAEGADIEEEPAADEALTQEEKTDLALPYRYLRGTRYKYLYRAGYSNLYKVTEKPELNEDSENGQTYIGGAFDPGYYGTVGSYSLNDKTIAAHLTVQGTSIQDRAVWQAKNNTNYYTNSSVAWAAGTAHLRSGELSQNTVIYGHNWNNCFAPFKKTGSQFESLMAYTYEDFVKENQYIYLTTNSGVHTFRIFAVCFTKDLSFYINCNNVDVTSIASTAKSKSLFDFGVKVSSSDKLITLSTCTRYFSNLGANQRFIIMGKLVS